MVKPGMCFYNGLLGLMETAGAHGIPHAFVIDVSGKIIFSGHPADPSFDAALSQSTSGVSSSGSDNTKKEKQALPLITDSYLQLMDKSAKVT